MTNLAEEVASELGVSDPIELAERFGHAVLGPIVAEFCLRMWWCTDMVDEPDESVLLFCARGGLRMQAAYERFLTATGLPSRLPLASLMVSRAVAMRGCLVRVIRDDLRELPAVAATVIDYEFSAQTVRRAAAALAGIDADSIDPVWEIACTPAALVALLRHSDGEPVVTAIEHQEALFAAHLDEALNGRSRAILIDTGFYGTTRELMAEGYPEIDFGSVMLVRSYRAGYPRRGARSVGLLVEASAYSPLLRRTALLRYWHFIEWLFEPELPSVRSFRREGRTVRSNLEVDDWRARVSPSPGSPFSGLIRYLDQLSGPSAVRIVEDADRAWTELHKAIVWPGRSASLALAVGRRTHDFGRDESWTARPWRGPLAALRGSTMWREGEIANSGTPLRLPLLFAIESAYTLRYLRNRLARRPR